MAVQVMMKGALVLVCITLLPACSSIVTIPGGCGTEGRSGTCLGEMSIPDTETATFELASQQAIDAIYSEDFVRDLALFVNEDAKSGEHTAAWERFVISKEVASLRAEVTGVNIDTYGGIWGWILNVFAGNLAKDGVENGPILLNRWALPRPSESIANTITHEVSHRAGMVHPHSNSNLTIAQCEPPYVVGTLVEKTIVGVAWKPSQFDCHSFGQERWKRAQQIAPADRPQKGAPGG